MLFAEGSSIVYFHNLAFDGSFILQWFFKQGWEDVTGEAIALEEMPVKSFRYSIAKKGQWYLIECRHWKGFTIFRDSLKLLPLSVRAIGESFQTKHQKLEMDYDSHNEEKEVSSDEMDYFLNDLYVPAEALQQMFEEGHTRLTIGSCCMAEFKRLLASSRRLNKERAREHWEALFPNVYEMECRASGFDTIGHYCLRAYHGAFVYLNPDFKGKTVGRGYTLDVTSLYPSRMHSCGGQAFPVGEPRFHKGAPAFLPSEEGFVRFSCTFDVKSGKLPFIHIRNSYLYKASECLSTTRVVSHGVELNLPVELVLTKCDIMKFFCHYDVNDLTWKDWIAFDSCIGIFDEYIDKWIKIKSREKGGKRQIAKLFLNNLYGKFASTTDSSYKKAFIEKGVLRFYDVDEHEKEPGYIPIGAYVTSSAMCFTLSAAQANHEEGRFIYSDTDSLHMIGDPSDAKGVKISESNLNEWKLESEWSEARFVGPKRYIERYCPEYETDGCQHFHITCGGMPQNVKDDVIGMIESGNLFHQEEIGLEAEGIDIFSIGLSLSGKLMKKQVEGGVILEETTYRMKNES